MPHPAIEVLNIRRDVRQVEHLPVDLEPRRGRQPGIGAGQAVLLLEQCCDGRREGGHIHLPQPHHIGRHGSLQPRAVGVGQQFRLDRRIMADRHRTQSIRELPQSGGGLIGRVLLKPELRHGRPGRVVAPVRLPQSQRFIALVLVQQQLDRRVTGGQRRGAWCHHGDIVQMDCHRSSHHQDAGSTAPAQAAPLN
jgi:hypothetical protein